MQQALTKNKALQNALRYSLDSYLRLFYNSATKHYNRSSLEARTNRLKVPSLLVYSRSDPIASPQIIDNEVAKFRENNITVRTAVFPDSDHVSHFHKYPLEYMAALDDFLKVIGFTHESEKEHGKVPVDKFSLE